MAYMQWPSALLPSSYDLYLAFNTQSGGVSPFDKSEQTLEQPGARWGARLNFENLSISEGRLLTAFLHGLRGRAGRFTWGPPSWAPQGSAIADGGSSVINGASQSGVLVQTRGFVASRPAIFYPGDFLSWPDTTGRPQLHQVVADGAVPNGNFVATGSNAGGLCSFRVSPPIRRSPNDGAVLSIAAPTGLFRLSKDAVPPSFTGGMFASCSVDIEESIF